MKVLHVLNELRSSGAEIMLDQAYSWWRERGVESQILAMGAERGPFAEQLERTGYRIWHLPSPRLSWFSRAWKFWKLLSRERFDIVHIHSEGEFARLAPVALLRGCRVVRTVHNCFVFSGWRRWRRFLRFRLFTVCGGKVIAIGDSVLNNEQTRYHTPCRMAENWCDSKKFVPETDAEKSRRELQLPEAYPILCSVGNCSETKNHPVILQALKQLLPEFPKILYLHVGEEDRGQSERKLAASLGVENHVRFLGRVSPLPALQAAEIFVMPSHYEGFSIAALEALMCGKRAVFSNCSGLIDWKKYKLPQLCYAEPEVGAIAQAIRRALSPACTPDLEKVGKLREHYSVERGAARYLAIWEELRK